MRMKSAALLAIGLLSVNFGLLDSARCQTSLAPPLSLARPAPAPDADAAPPAIIYASPPTATDDTPPPKATAKRAAPPVAARDAPPSPKPAADHDGFTTSIEDEPVAKLPVSPRAANRPKPKKEADSIAGQPWAPSPEDEQLRRKLTICRDCK